MITKIDWHLGAMRKTCNKYPLESIFSKMVYHPHKLTCILVSSTFATSQKHASISVWANTEAKEDTKQWKKWG